MVFIFAFFQMSTSKWTVKKKENPQWMRETDEFAKCADLEDVSEGEIT